jgi:hypothetical protein
MKSFIAVFAVVLLAFGASILYYRGDFGSSSQTPAPKNESTQSTPKVNSPSNPGSSFDIAAKPNSSSTLGATTTPPVAEPTYLSLVINQTPTGSVKEQASVNFKSTAKDKNGALVGVAANWSVTDASVGTLSATSGTDVTFAAKKVGKTKVTASYQSLTATVTVTVVSAGPVLGAETAAPAPEKPAVTPVEIRLYDTNGSRLNSGDTRTYTAQVFYSDNSLKSVDVAWSVDPGDLGSLNKTKGSSVDFKAGRSGSGTLKATLNNLTSSLYLQVN